MENEVMCERKLSKIGHSGSLMLVLPRWWVQSRKLQGGDSIMVSTDGKGGLNLAPRSLEEAANEKKD